MPGRNMRGAEKGAGAPDGVRIRLERIIDAVSDGVVVFDGAGRIESVNLAAARIFGRAQRAMVGMDVAAVFDEPPSGAGAREPRECIAWRADGSGVRVEACVHDAKVDGAVRHVATVRDLTEIVYTRSRLAEQAFLLEKTHTFMLTTLPGVGIDWCNPSFESLTGYKLAEMRGQRAIELFVDASSPPQGVAEVLRAIAAGESFSVELVLRHRTGRPFWVQVDGHPLPGEAGAGGRYVALGSEITARKREQQLRDDFVSTVSHELRTPLTVVRGAYEALPLALGAAARGPAAELLAMGARNAEQLARLIDDLLDANRLAAGVVRFESQHIDLLEPVGDALTAIAAFADTRQVRVRAALPDGPANVFLDGQRVRQVLVNLLSNAVKFSPPHAEVLLVVEMDEERARIAVVDHGEGIPLDFQPRVFARFSRDAAVKARGTDGFGLGLYITRCLVEQMGGRIGFTSVPGQGSRFVVDIPRCCRTPASSPPRTRASGYNMVNQIKNPVNP